MPCYVYKCPECGHVFDGFRSIARRDDPITCPECGHEHALREEIPLEGSRIDTEGGYQFAFFTKKDGRKIPGHLAKDAPLKKSPGKFR